MSYPKRMAFGTRSVASKDLPIGERIKVLAEIHAKLRAAYAAGVPFYTKEALSRIFNQYEELVASAAGKKFWIRGVDGVDVEFASEIGMPWMAGDVAAGCEDVLCVHLLLRIPSPSDLILYAAVVCRKPSTSRTSP